MEVGKPLGLLPCGLGSRDTLRTECGMMLYGHDIDRQHTPLEAVYSWVVSFEKDFVGKPALQKQQEEGLKRKLVGFEMVDRGIARNPYPIYFNGEEVGVVTSGTPSPTTGKNIGMGYVRYDLRKPDTMIDIKIRDNFVKAKVVKLPFYKK
jgi:aminomethyltransferase